MKPYSDLEVCLYHNDHQTAASLMLDDLAPVAVTQNGEIRPFNDHGAGMSSEQGLYRYLEDNLLGQFPEIRGSFFILIDWHFNHGSSQNGYQIIREGFSEKYLEFLHSLCGRFDFAFHGTTHGKIENGQVKQEFSYLSPADIPRMQQKLSDFQESSGLGFNGGKFPAYQSNQHSLEIIEALGFKWWAYDNGTNSLKKGLLSPAYIGPKNSILKIPSNIGGDAFKVNLRKTNRTGIAKGLIDKARHALAEWKIQHFYEKHIPICIQEHYNPLRVDGAFQRPNIYDDQLSLARIYGILRGADIWHCSCDELAHYVENRDHSQLELKENGFALYYQGRYENASLSLASFTLESIFDREGKELKGHRRNGRWIFNGISPGEYYFSDVPKTAG